MCIPLGSWRRTDDAATQHAVAATRWAWRSDQNQKIPTHDQSEADDEPILSFMDETFCNLHWNFLKINVIYVFPIFRFLNLENQREPFGKKHHYPSCGEIRPTLSLKLYV